MGGAIRLFTLITSTTTSSSPLLLPHHRYCPALLRLSRCHGDSKLSILTLPRRFRSFHNQCRHHRSSSPSTPPSFRLIKTSHQFHVEATPAAQFTNSSNQLSPVFHQWPEWSNFIHNISAAGYFNRQGMGSELEEFVDAENLPDDFVRTAVACLAFGRDKPQILGLLSRGDIATVINNGRPSLFKNADELVRRMQLFLDEQNDKVPSSERPQTVDIMKFLVSCASNVMPFGDNKEAVELCVRNIFSQLSSFSYKTTLSYQPSSVVQNQYGDSYAQGPKPVGPNIEMKRGDWICSRCNFLNFARNNKCLECEEARPKRQLTGGEWECPQCDFFNYGRNMTCLRCDCKRPGEVSLGATGSSPGLGSGYGSRLSNSNTESRLAANEQKAQRWFSQISQSENSSDVNIADTDFPEIMPLRKGANRFVVSTRKTPLERRQADAPDTETNGNDRHVGQQQLLENSMGQNQNLSCKEENEQAENSDRWFKRVAELHNVEDVECANSDVDFPEIMPMRKGENRFVVAKKKDRSLTNATYKRRAAMEQANDTSYVPFVPFPPNYFAKKDEQQPEGRPDLTNKVMETASSSRLESSDSSLGPGVSNSASVQGTSNQQYATGQWDSRTSGDNMFEMNKNSAFEATTPRMQSRNLANPNPDPRHTINDNIGGAPNIISTQRNSGLQNVNSNSAGSTTQSSGWSGKSLEGSAVKEPDPLDMSEEAKAERWFKRVAQIKDISELSQIPDEDFPSIMPMRKGVNRFVVSKRKTPLERRLTSTQYRWNLPIVSSDQPPTKSNDDSQ
ncbi:Zinc finger protein VAR3, chloroplastic [Linum perenne]